MLTLARYGTRDLGRAKQFYDALAPLLGAQQIIARDDVVSYRGPGGGMFLIGTPFEGEASVGNGTQMGFGVPDRQTVDAVYAKALELGGTCVGPAGPRGADGAFYCAYFRDLDGNKIMVFETTMQTA